MRILFRSDSSSQIGLGHIMRDLVLAKEYIDEDIFFACQNLEGNIINKIEYPVHILASNDIDELIQVIKSLNIELLIIDHYHINYEDEKQIKEQTGIKILSFDDTYKKHYCDILLNHNISANSKKYGNLVPKHCELRCGSKYTLIREEFQKEKDIQREKIYDIFIAMGGADHTNINIKILKELPITSNIVLVTTTANANLELLQEFVSGKPNISLHINSNEIAKLMNQSKSAIITPSVVLHEILYMGLPFLAIKTAKNQEDIYQYLLSNGYNVLDKFNERVIKEWKI